MQASRTDARFSTYSGAPSLQPSLAPTLDTQATSNRCSTMPRNQQQQSSNEKSSGSTMYSNSNQSSSTISTNNDGKSADLKQWAGTLSRMQDARLDQQRYVMTDKKSDEVSQLALGAKVERALARRMTGQDATFRKKVKPLGDIEKRSLEVEAN